MLSISISLTFKDSTYFGAKRAQQLVGMTAIRIQLTKQTLNNVSIADNIFAKK